MSARTARVLALAVGLSLLGTARAEAGVALLVHEAVGFEAETSSAGHAAIYLSNVCSDNGRLLRVCHPGEEGVVVGTYPEILQGIDIYWFAVPLRVYLYGGQDAPVYGNHDILTLMRRHYGETQPEVVPNGLKDDGTPRGWWPMFIGNALQRTVYALQLATPADQDRIVIDALNRMQTARAFDVTYNNCADFSKFILNTYFPGSVRRDGVSDFSFTTPKALARDLAAYGRAHADARFEIVRYRQIQGPLWRSRPVHSLSEKFATSRKYVGLTAFLNPIAPVVLTTLAAVRAPFNLEDSMREQRGDRLPSIGAGDVRRPPPPSKAYERRFDTLAAEAIEHGLFPDRGAVRKFAGVLQTISRPEYDDEGQLRLAVGVGDGLRYVHLTRCNLESGTSDPRLGYQLLLSVVARDLDGADGQQATGDELANSFDLLERLRERPGVWEDGGALHCPANAACGVPPHLSWWKRVLLHVTR